MTKQELVLEFLIHIEWNLAGDLNCRKAAEAMGCSLQYIEEAFYDLSGMCLIQYIPLRILAEAKINLAAGYSLKEVAERYNMKPEILIHSFQKEFGDSIFSDEEISFPLPLGKKLISTLMRELEHSQKGKVLG